MPGLFKTMHMFLHTFAVLVDYLEDGLPWSAATSWQAAELSQSGLNLSGCAKMPCITITAIQLGCINCNELSFPF